MAWYLAYAGRLPAANVWVAASVYLSMSVSERTLTQVCDADFAQMQHTLRVLPCWLTQNTHSRRNLRRATCEYSSRMMWYVASRCRR